MLPLDTGPGAKEAQEPSAETAPEHLSDTLIAETIVHNIRTIPGVFDMGEGLFAKAVTFGPGKRVPGVVIFHPTSDSLAVEAHVVLDDSTFTKAYSELSASDAQSRSDTTPILLRFTDQVRTVVIQTLEQLGFPASTLVDVTIDDIR
jgi:hypothetical protein